jgi:hypothetical protein
VGAPVVLVAVQVSSVQSLDEFAIAGSVYFAVMAAAIVTGICVSALASHDLNGSFSHATVAIFNVFFF